MCMDGQEFIDPASLEGIDCAVHILRQFSRRCYVLRMPFYGSLFYSVNVRRVNFQLTHVDSVLPGHY